jgi:hypothetical protein
MTGRFSAQRHLGPVLFGLTILAFLLPFATVSCNGAETTFTGVQLVTKTVPAGGIVDGKQLGDHVEEEASSLAMAAFASAVVGFFLTALGRVKGPGWLAAAGLTSTLLLGSDGFDIYGPTITYRAGYVLTLFLFTAASFLFAARAIKRRRARKRVGATGQPVPKEVL